MTAGPWVSYNHLPLKIGDGTLDLDAASHFRVVLLSSSYTPSRAHTAWSSLSSYELATANGYTQGGVGITNTYTANGATSTFDSDDPDWTVSSSALAARYAALVHDANADGALASGDVVMAYCLLDTTPADYSVNPGNHFTIQIDANGYFQIGDAA
jgi:hypothetical protein